MTNFDEWWYSKPHRAKYSTDSPPYLAAREAWGELAHDAALWHGINSLFNYPGKTLEELVLKIIEERTSKQ